MSPKALSKLRNGKKCRRPLPVRCEDLRGHGHTLLDYTGTQQRRFGCDRDNLLARILAAPTLVVSIPETSKTHFSIGDRELTAAA